MSGSRTRRQFLAAGTATVMGGLGVREARALRAGVRPSLHLATFRLDVTPPKGHSLCGGWIRPVVDVDDRLEAIGLVLLGAGKPIVICAVDWTGILNSGHLIWREAIAEAVGTEADRVAVQCVHQHNAPFACLDAERLVDGKENLAHIVSADFFRVCVDRARKAVAEAIARARPLTHVAHGRGRVAKVASNRRVLGANGKGEHWRGSSTRSVALRALPEGEIDPWLRTVAFYDGPKKLAACHYYATHPMSYYGDGRVSSDFAGLARKARQKAEPETTHIYFTGCAGNIAAGKYNDGSKERRPILTRRLHEGIVRSEKQLRPEPIEAVEWRTREILPPGRSILRKDKLRAAIANAGERAAIRGRSAYMLAFLERLEGKQPIVLSALHIGDASLLHLPAECFLEYQLRAQKLGRERFVATAAYGDGGPWYIPTTEAYPQGGYEVSVAFCDPGVDGTLTRGIGELLA